MFAEFMSGEVGGAVRTPLNIPLTIAKTREALHAVTRKK